MTGVQTCALPIYNAPEFLSSQCSMTVSSQCSIFLVITIFHDRVIKMLHGPCHHNAPEFLSSNCSKRGPLFIAVRGPLTIVASLVVEHRLQTRRLGSCGTRAQLLCGMWDLPRPGLEPASPALAGRFSITAPPGKPLSYPFDLLNLI